MTLLLLAACSKEEGDANVKDDERVPLRIVSSIEVERLGITRAYDTQWEDADQIGLYCTTNGTSTTYIDHASTPTTCANLAYTFADGTAYETYPGSVTTYRAFTGTTVYLPADGSNIDVYAYYPHSTASSQITTNSITNIAINVSDQTSQKAIDFMRAEVQDRNTANNVAALLFTHQLVKLQFNVKRGADMLEDEISQAFTNSRLSLTVGRQPTEATYNLYTGDIRITALDSPTPTSSPITTHIMTTAETGYDKSFEAIVLPNEATYNPAADRTVTITIGTANHPTAYTYTFTIGSGTTFLSGNKYIYNVTVNATSIQVDPTKYTEQW